MSLKGRILQTFFNKRLRLFWLVIGVAWIVSIAQAVIFPSHRLGPFGNGLPADMKTFQSQHWHILLDYPERWVPIETLHGSGGDKEIIIFVGTPGRSWPNVYVATRTFSDGDLSQVAAWGEDRASMHDGYVSTSLESLGTAAFEGLIREYQWTTPGSLSIGIVTLHCKDWYVLKGTSAYDLSFCVEQEDWAECKPFFQRMIESFKVE